MDTMSSGKNTPLRRGIKMAFGFSNKQLIVIVLLATLAAIFVVPVASKYIPGAASK